MVRTLSDAHRQWVKRSPDETFSSLENLLDFKQNQKDASESRIINLNELKLGIEKNNGININGSHSLSYLTNWSFGQLCRLVGAPAKYLRGMPNDITRDCLQYGLNNSGQKCQILNRLSGNELLTDRDNYMAAFTGPQYGRIWDAEVAESLGNAIDGSSWHLPLGQDGQPRGLYASDHDMFAFMISDENPVKIYDSELKKGFFCWNSETGASSFGLMTFLYDNMCSNQIIWGVEQLNEIRIYHRKQAIGKFYNEAIPALNRFVENRNINESIEATVNVAYNQNVGNTEKEVLDWFKNKPFTKNEIHGALELGMTQGTDIGNLWGIVQGLTAYAREIPYIDKKVNLERRAGALLM